MPRVKHDNGQQSAAIHQEVLPAAGNDNAEKLSKQKMNNTNNKLSPSTIRVGESEYDINMLNGAAKQMIANIQNVNSEIARQEMLLMHLQNARNAYINALKQNL